MDFSVITKPWTARLIADVLCTGGVGPMTVAMLMENTVISAARYSVAILMFVVKREKYDFL
jgi:5,10-methylene-tetrahydrofolate dehydrogenase/methenyl tetrahydrofolate cyclohydrolase